MLRFEKFVASLCIPWSIYTNRDTGMFQYRDFTGPEHRKIQQHIKLHDIIPNHPKLESIKYLWAKFSEIMSLLKADNVDPKFFEREARSWVAKYSSTFQSKDVTPYMHVFMNHLSESLEMHGNLNKFNQQAMEKLNDTITVLYFRSSNHRNTEAFVQVIKKQNRISYLHDTYKENPIFQVHCSLCGECGHNRRTCYLKFRPSRDFSGRLQH